MTAPPIVAASEPLERATAVRDYVCSACGYGIAPHGRLPEACPMCGGRAWLPFAAVRVAERAA